MMKRLIAPLVAAFALCAGSTRAELLFGEGFDYPNGSITNVASDVWVHHSGTADLQIIDGKAFVDGTKSEDVNRAISGDPQTAFAAFKLNLTSLPTASTYFAHFKDSGTQNFRARVFAVTNGALPGFFRIGVAAAAGSPNAVFSQDLAMNQDYWVVVGWDRGSLLATLWINPTNEGDPTVLSTDSTSDVPNVAFAFRQAAGQGQMFIDDLQVATTFAEAVTNTPVATSILVPPASITANVGDVKQLFAVATGSGTLNFEWKKGATVVASGTNVLSFPSIQEADAGSYTVTVSGANGTVTSTAVTVTVNVGITPPSIASQPSDANVTLGTTVNLSVAAVGSNPLSYQWYFNSNAISGEMFETLPLGAIQASQAGFYHVEVSNEGGTAKSRVAQVSVRGPISTNIAYLRTLVDANYVASDTTNLYTVEGIVTTHANLTSAGNRLFYIQDNEAGIAVFNGGGTSLPAAGDRVRVTAPLVSFSGLLELSPSASNPNHLVEILSSGNPIPEAKVLTFSLTNNLPAIEALEGSLVKVVNVSLPAGETTFATGNRTYVMTNSAGETFALFSSTYVTTIAGQPIPASPLTITGVLGQFNSNTAQNPSAGYQLIATRMEDLEAGTAEHPPFTLSVAKGEGGAVVIAWPAQTTATYSVVGAGEVTGPFTNVVSGLTFPSGSGSYTVPGNGGLGVYRVVTP